MSARIDRRQFVLGGVVGVTVGSAPAMAPRAATHPISLPTSAGMVSTLVFVRPELLRAPGFESMVFRQGERIHEIRQDWLELWPEQALPHLLAGGRIAGLTSHADYQVVTHLIGTLREVDVHGAFLAEGTGVKAAAATAASVESGKCCDGLRERMDWLLHAPRSQEHHHHLQKLGSTTVWTFARTASTAAV